MAQSEIAQLARDLEGDFKYATRCGIPLIIATCGDPRSLTYLDVEELRALLSKAVPEGVLLYQPN